MFSLGFRNLIDISCFDAVWTDLKCSGNAAGTALHSYWACNIQYHKNNCTNARQCSKRNESEEYTVNKRQSLQCPQDTKKYWTLFKFCFTSDYSCPNQETCRYLQAKHMNTWKQIVGAFTGICLLKSILVSIFHRLFLLSNIWRYVEIYSLRLQ